MSAKLLRWPQGMYNIGAFINRIGFGSPLSSLVLLIIMIREAKAKEYQW